MKRLIATFALSVLVVVLTLSVALSIGTALSSLEESRVEAPVLDECEGN